MSSATNNTEHNGGVSAPETTLPDEQTTRTLEDRYGTGRKKRIDKRVGIGFASALIVGGIAFLAFGGMPTSESAIEFRDIAHSIEDDDIHVSITFEVTAPVGSSVACAVEALNPSYAVVGYKLVELPPSDQLIRGVTEELVTTNRATTVTVDYCWVRESGV